MRAEVVAIGDELTSGQRLDTNTQWLSQQLSDLGIEVMFHTTVGDDLAANVDVFRSAIARADIVVCTGGLGPTADDLTREALSAAMEVELVLDTGSLEHIRRLFSSRGREMPERNQRQAYFPAGAAPILNPNGSAPGVHAVVTQPGATPCNVFALPGVPAEMREMWQATVAPAAASLRPDPCVIRHRAIKIFGPGESQLESMLPDLIRRGREPRVGITASGATLTLRITSAGKDAADCDAIMQPTADEIYQIVGKHIFGEGDDELQHAVLRLLAAGSQTLATAEGFTRGLVAGWLNEADLQGKHFAGGSIVSDGRGDLVEWAKESRSRLGTTFGLAVGPPKDDETVEVVLANPTEVLQEKFKLGGHPAVVGPRIGKSALNFLRLHLLSS